MTHSEFLRRALGKQGRDEMEWHRWRLGITYMVNVQAGKGQSIKPQDVMRLPMDSGSDNGIDAATKEELKRFMSGG